MCAGFPSPALSRAAMRRIASGTVRRLSRSCTYPVAPCARCAVGPTANSCRRAAPYSRQHYRYKHDESSSSSESPTNTNVVNTNADNNRERLFLSTSVLEPFSVPLSLTDVHLRNEQLPFAYVYKATLDEDRLITSLREVLRRYPILGAKIDFAAGKVPTLECSVDDTVPMSFGWSEMTLEEWLVEKRSGRMQHTNWRGGGGAPLLSPLFDDLSSSRWVDGNDSDEDVAGAKQSNDNVATVRITNFEGGGTAVGINMSHLLGDASSCFRIAQVWGREMRGLDHPIGASNNRADATLTGMVSPEMAELLNLDAEAELEGSAAAVTPGFDFFSGIREFLEGCVSADAPLLNEDDSDASIGCDANDSHEYIRLPFSPQLLRALKVYGLAHCASIETFTPALLNDSNWVSTNDMVTAFGWMMKRHIARKPDWNISMVVNLRNKGGIHEFSCVKDVDGANGTFGNALTNIVAKLPPSKRETYDLPNDGQASMAEIGAAAVAIRQSLAENASDIPDLLSLSRLGKALQAANQGSCFSSTSWRQFPLWDISFSDDDNEDGKLLSGLDGFYGRPSHPLPIGDTYASVIVPNVCGGCTYKLLAPTRQVQSILELHEYLSSQFLAWASKQDASSKD